MKNKEIKYKDMLYNATAVMEVSSYRVNVECPSCETLQHFHLNAMQARPEAVSCIICGVTLKLAYTKIEVE